MPLCTMPKSQTETVAPSFNKIRIEIYNSKSKKVFDLPFDLLPADQAFTLGDCHERRIKVKCLLETNPANFKTAQFRDRLERLQGTFSRFGVRSFTNPKPRCEFRKYLVKNADDSVEPNLRLCLASCKECKEKKATQKEK